MHRITLHRLVPALVALVSLALGACGDDSGTTTDGAGACAAGLKPGQLVITEIMADPAGADDDGVEWFELYNPGPDEVSLAELGLEYSKVDGTDGEGHRIPDSGLTLAPGAYMTFGRVIEDMRPEHIDYAYGADLTMGNTGGKLRVVCGDTVIDDALYEDLGDGATRQLDARIDPPDAEANDVLTHWCDGAEPYGDEFGTPGAANTKCPLVAPGCGQCFEGEELRDVIAPRPGQLVINEFMPNASSAPESVGEWFEVFVTDGPVDLNCLQYGGNTGKFAADPGDAESITAPACQTFEAGSFVIFGDMEKWPAADYELGFSLVDSKTTSNQDPGIYLAYNDTILDEIHYSKANDAIAWSLDPDFADPADNDDPAAFCLAVDPFIAGELGTPGAENPQCPESCPANSCIDGDACRAIVPLAPGDLLITEVFPDPGAMSPDGEWFEFIVGKDADLNGLSFAKTLSATVSVPGAECRPVAAGDLVLVAATADAAMNGGITPDIVFDKLTLTNSGSSLVVGIVGSDGLPTQLDMVTWGTTQDGKAHQLTVELVPASGDLDETINDDLGAWCDANVPFGVSDFGTPDAANTSCEGPPPGDPMCLDGDTARPINFPALGDLLIAEIHPDPKALLEQNPASGEPKGEWFEIWAAADVDLNGLELGNPALKYTIPSGETAPCVPVAKGTLAVLTRRGDPTDPPLIAEDPLDNGGIPNPAAEYDGLSLSNSGGTLTIGVGGMEIDSVTFTKPMIGKAQQLGINAGCLLEDTSLDPACNDDASLWCPATEDYGLGDFGTPATDNGLCIPPPPPGQCFDPGMMMNRPINAPSFGDLVITELQANPMGDDANKEWVEVYVKNAVDLNDLKVLGAGDPPQTDIDAAIPACTSNICMPLAADTYILIAEVIEDAMNGELPQGDCKLVPTLSNSNDGVAIAHGGTMLHGVSWSASMADGDVTMLDPLDKHPMYIDADAPPWCDVAGPGTPKQENPQCP
jgi:hypothetical protein